MQNRGLEKFSTSGLQSVRVKDRAKCRARQGVDAGSGLWRALVALAFILGRAWCQLGTQTQGAVKGNFLN